MRNKETARLGASLYHVSHTLDSAHCVSCANASFHICERGMLLRMSHIRVSFIISPSRQHMLQRSVNVSGSTEASQLCSAEIIHGGQKNCSTYSDAPARHPVTFASIRIVKNGPGLTIVPKEQLDSLSPGGSFLPSNNT